jgi:TonB family protein
MGLPAQGPNEGFVMEAEGAQHLLEHPDPIYPPIAKAAHVHGSVLLHADVDEHGKVIHVEAIGGPPMLRQAAIDAVQHWSYRPFEADGKPASVHVVVSVPFSLGIPDATEKSDEAIGQAYFPKADECRAANHAGQWEKAVTLCGDLNTIASRFPDERQRELEIQDAHVEYGEALAFSGKLAQAGEQFDAAVALAQKYLKPSQTEYAGPFFWRAFSEHARAMPVEAERDYSTAESAWRKAMVALPDMKTIYGRELAHCLAYHSVLADQTGRPKEADAMRAEAAKLDPHALDGLPKKEQ